MATRLCTLCSQQPPANGASFYAACLLTNTEAEAQRQRHCTTGYRGLQDREYCSAAAHSWSGCGASGRNLAVRVPSHCTAPAGDMSPMQWGPLLSVVTCVTTRPSQLHTADTNICSELRPAACSTMQHYPALCSTAQVCPGPRHSADCPAPSRALYTPSPLYCTALYCTVHVWRGDVFCICTSVRERYKLH